MLYLITDEQERTKVGITDNEETLVRRVETLQTGNADRLTCYCVFTQYGIELERKILDYFKDFKSNGGREWLNLPPQPILEYIALETWGDWQGMNRERFWKLLGVQNAERNCSNHS